MHERERKYREKKEKQQVAPCMVMQAHLTLWFSFLLFVCFDARNFRR